MWPTTDPTTAPWRSDPDEYWRSIDAAVREEGCDSPVAVLDLTAFEHNVADLRRRAGGVPIRVASKSIRVRAVISEILGRPGFAGVLAYDVAEAVWLATKSDVSDVLLGYPSVRPHALRALVADDVARSRVTLLVDSVEHLDRVDAVTPPGGRGEVRVAIDLDASLRIGGGRVHLGVRRSPVHSPQQARALAENIDSRRGFALVGVMSYEAQVAGMGNGAAGRPLTNAAVRLLQRRSMAELIERRGAAIEAIGSICELEFVNGGGTGSLEVTATDPSVTDIAAGSGFFGGHLFDSYAHFRPAPAVAFGLDVVRLPAPGIATCAGGGWIASGPPGADRLPLPVWPAGLRYVGTEAAGEVQTPLRGTAGLTVGDRVWFRHTKSGEISERVNEVVMLARAGDGSARVVDRLPTYRGEGKCFL
ncbi:amino acid deaminase/aldolase [Gordonia pseudamarae]|jgi:D-serine deaminase-like pyridoxal phosphate-dependent protein|uniref:Amino acid deaminase/aldolase n=1 Tax=Gordonia pseudamarae TaxID=2831662 RepID=A0ABX6IGA8_9ACTN|nr:MULTISPECIES: alanine racemase [Gordonia]MBD0023656.1 alanine racemase [Gordonia sp. (in: high G+C Gram-positive bacteria)]QHN25469.1 amino acid deaminase/aldolase [Gordonia pseudamarae]QHN34401.1 amino acid deaminase/aldolase [Gordonia pseudamarae]